MNAPEDPFRGEIVIYHDPGGGVALDVRLEQETIWLSQKQISELFNKDVRTINEHIANVFHERELEREATIRKFRIVRREGKRNVQREIEHYNLDVVISVLLPGQEPRLCGRQQAHRCCAVSVVPRPERGPGKGAPFREYFGGHDTDDRREPTRRAGDPGADRHTSSLPWRGRMTNDTSERGLDRLICKALPRLPLRSAQQRRCGRTAFGQRWRWLEYR